MEEVQKKSNENKQCYISVQLHDKTIKALLDSGATDCFVGQEFFKLIPDATKFLYAIETPVGGVYANNQPFVCTHAINIDVEVQQQCVPVTAYYSPSSHYPLILGYNFLRNGNITVDFRTLGLSRSADALVKNSTAIQLPPQSETIIKAYLSHQIASNSAIISASHQLSTKGLLCANALVNPAHEFVPIKLLNISSHTVSLPAHFCVGICEQASEDVVPSTHKHMSVNAVTKRDAPLVDRKTFLQQFSLPEEISLNDAESFRSLLWEFKDIFPDKSEKFGCTNLIKFRITLRKDSHPIKARPYRSNPRLRKEITRQVQDMMNDDIIRPSTSSYVSPVLLVEKADGSLRFST